MKISSRTLKSIAASAGLSAAITTASADQAPARIAPAKPESKDQVAEADAVSAKVLFAKADLNKDGKLSVEEFSKAYAVIVAQERAKARIHPRPVAPHFPDGCPGCGLG